MPRQIRTRISPTLQVAFAHTNIAKGSFAYLVVKRPMKYQSGIEVMLGDNVTVNIPTGDEPARVVMLGETYEHLDLDKSFRDWVKKDRVLEETSVVIEWINKNPFEHNDPKYAPVGNYMFTGLDSGVSFQKRSTEREI